MIIVFKVLLCLVLIGCLWVLGQLVMAMREFMAMERSVAIERREARNRAPKQTPPDALASAVSVMNSATLSAVNALMCEECGREQESMTAMATHQCSAGFSVVPSTFEAWARESTRD